LAFGRLQVACVEMMDGWIHLLLACMAYDPVCAALTWATTCGIFACSHSGGVVLAPLYVVALFM